MLIVAVVGPTATGKSDLALDLAQRWGETTPGGAEIVNADAYQLYRGMDVGTAKVPPGERRGIAHHQLDVVDPEQDASVARYQQAARADVAAILARGARPVVVGGSGLYVRALLDVMDFPGTDPRVRAAIEDRAERDGRRALHAELERVDPAAAASIGPHNTRRLVRALEVVAITGRPYSANLPRQEHVLPTVQIGLDADRATLDARIGARVDRMFDAGLVAEVEALAPRLGRTAARAVGYAEVLELLAGRVDAPTARDQVAAATRRLARKQMGWFGRDPRVHWLDADAPDLLDQALAVVADADARADRQGGAHAPAAAPVRRSLGS